jgi:hypothetical protein
MFYSDGGAEYSTINSINRSSLPPNHEILKPEVCGLGLNKIVENDNARLLQGQYRRGLAFAQQGGPRSGYVGIMARFTIELAG